MTEAQSKHRVLPLVFIVKWAKFISDERTIIDDYRGVYTTEQKWHGSDENWNSSNRPMNLQK